MDKHIAALERMENAIHTLLIIGGCPFERAPEDVQADVEALRAATALMRGQSDACAWQKDDDEWEGAHWDSACGEKYFFVEGGPSDNGHKFCHGCGKPLHIIEPKGPADEQ